MAESDTISIDEIHYPGPNKPKRIKPRSIWKRLLYAAVQCFVIMLIAVPHLTCTFLIIPAWWDFDIGNWKCLTTLLIFNFGIVMIYTNYALACFTNPGAVWGYVCQFPFRHYNNFVNKYLLNIYSFALWTFPISVPARNIQASQHTRRRRASNRAANYQMVSLLSWL